MLERIQNTGNTQNVPKTLSIGKDGETFDFNIFGNGFATNKVFDEILKDYDTDNSGIIEKNELEAFKKALMKAAGEDNILDTKELNKLLTKSEKTTEFSIKTTALFKAFITAMKNGPDKLKLNESSPRETTLTSMAEDGSGVMVVLFKSGNGEDAYVVKTFSAGGKLKESTECNNVEYKDGVPMPFRGSKNLTSHIVYNDKGQITEQTSVYQGDKRIAQYSDSTFNQYDDNGNLIYRAEKFTNRTNGNKDAILTLYGEGNSIKQKFTYSEAFGLKRTELINYDNNEIISKEVKHEKEDIVTVEEYSGKNLANRLEHLPDKITVYDKSTGRIKSVETNIFDEHGILTGKILNENNTVKQFDYTDVNGIIEHSKQGGIGNCFLLGTINSLNTSTAGREILNNSVKKETITDENGKEQIVYRISFKGAAQITEDLTNGIRNFPKDKVFIQPEYTITAEELEEAALKSGKNYSSGDKDVLLHELAYEKYRQDVVKTIQANDVDDSPISAPKYISGLDVPTGFGTNPEDIGSGNTLGMTMYLYTGKKSDVYFNTSNKLPVCEIDSDGNISAVKNNTADNNARAIESESNVFNKRYDDAEQVIKLLKNNTDKEGNFKNYIVETSLNITSQIVDGKAVSNAGHAFTVKGIKGNKVILINPWDSSKEAEISIKDFIKAAGTINIVNLE